MSQGLQKTDILAYMRGYVPRTASFSAGEQEINAPKTYSFLILLPTEPASARRIKNEILLLERLGHRVDFWSATGLESRSVLVQQKLLLPVNDTSPLWEEYDVLFARLSRGQIAQLALGLTDDYITRLLIEALSEGKAVCVDVETLLPPIDKSPLPLIDLYAGYRKTLQTFGVCEISPNPLVPSLLTYCANNSKSMDSNVSESTTNRTVVTRRDLMALPEGDTMYIKPGTIITDLAKETAVQRHITLQTCVNHISA